MSRRDTIIIAVLLNAGVLAILFMLAVNEKEEDRVLLHAAPPAISREQVRTEPKTIVLSTPPTEEFIDFNMDDSITSAADESFPYGQQPLAINSAVSEPTKAPHPQMTSKAQASNESYVEVTVKRGDSLDKLARSNGTTIEAVKSANNLRSDMLNIGQVLRIPVANKTTIVQKSPPVKKASPDAADGIYYTVKTGDSPWKIAKQNNMNVDDLLKLNNLDDEKARNLKVGDKIRVK